MDSLESFVGTQAIQSFVAFLDLILQLLIYVWMFCNGLLVVSRICILYYMSNTSWSIHSLFLYGSDEYVVCAYIAV